MGGGPEGENGSAVASSPLRLVSGQRTRGGDAQRAWRNTAKLRYWSSRSADWTCPQLTILIASIDWAGPCDAVQLYYQLSDRTTQHLPSLLSIQSSQPHRSTPTVTPLRVPPTSHLVSGALPVADRGRHIPHNASLLDPPLPRSSRRDPIPPSSQHLLVLSSILRQLLLRLSLPTRLGKPNWQHGLQHDPEGAGNWLGDRGTWIRGGSFWVARTESKLREERWSYARRETLRGTRAARGLCGGLRGYSEEERGDVGSGGVWFGRRAGRV